ncbi:hypothetical protein SAMN02745121_09060 [Nannocystis exedens]|uniref:Uncharacterized protein n=1 Tax=Nannocystis exedens TaxID=54 RepID=A0A1I2IWI3_9BACT|nr:heme-binding protein [Nannocystis exedens]PCC68809.1 hypothetical protein NAEX_01829 [Nannocystis exedens]SFF46842.1 hypothetical protein SAMN02745121_09060 [Nannocystis exedens]
MTAAPLYPQRRSRPRFQLKGQLAGFTLSPIGWLAYTSGRIRRAAATPAACLVGEFTRILAGANTWQGKGFNQIWRPFPDPTKKQDRFLELNSTIETLEFGDSLGQIPNRGLFGQPDITLFGLTYLQQISDANVKGPNGQPAGLHVEPGIWLNVPATTDPQDPATVARLASIPHGTTIVVQGAGSVVAGPPEIADNDIFPFPIGQPSKPITDFPEQNLSIPTDFRSKPDDIRGITQEMVNNPNSVLQTVIREQRITSTTVLQISSANRTPPPSSGGGTSNIAFLGPNANAVEIDAIFWIETVQTGDTVTHQLQYTQRVLLNFDGLSWPHVSVATLTKVR